MVLQLFLLCFLSAEATNSSALGPAYCNYTCSSNATCVGPANVSLPANETNVTGVCTCDSNFVGDGLVCDDYCTVCDANATCSLNGTVKVCECNTSFIGDGLLCTDVCDFCDENATCYNGPAETSRYCECNAGFVGNGFEPDELPCIEECSTCDPNAACTLTPGSYACACNHGYHGDGLLCDADECLLDTHDCDLHAVCNDTWGSYTCSCIAGYQGSGVSCGCAAQGACCCLGGVHPLLSEEDCAVHVPVGGQCCFVEGASRFSSCAHDELCSIPQQHTGVGECHVVTSPSCSVLYASSPLMLTLPILLATVA